ncbi:MAG: aspartate/tyrosine/aromatic aminotransferase [Chlamydiales bacterium]|nr:aspartate/tyrosine/aromatic aminotransferase [Chlamydiales bacterium]
MNFFESVEELPPDPIFGLNQAFQSDPRESKVNLGAGVYRTADLKPFILRTVKHAEGRLLEMEASKDYLPIDGLPEYVEATKKLVFSDENDPARVYGAQVPGGTAALRVGSDFLREHGYGLLYLSEQTWANHQRIFTEAGLKIKNYPYFDHRGHRLDFKGFCAELKRMPEKSVVLLQGCCHNPTGIDPTLEQWEEILRLIEVRNLFPFFDFAYQGFGVDPERDAAAIRLFARSGRQFAVAVSHSKNFGLYAERTGALYFVCSDEREAKKIGSRIKMVIRGLYSNPPCHGGRLVSLILQDEELKSHWLEELTSMRGRISQMRKTLVAMLETESKRFDFLAGQLGMFSYTGLDHETVERLIADYGIYLPRDGRINVAGLNQKNVRYVADAILAVTST